MRTASGSYSDPGVQRELKRLQDAVNLLSRRLDKQPKIPPPAAPVPSGGGIIGQASARSSSVRPAGFSGGEFYGWSFSDEEGQPLGLNDTLEPGGKGFTGPAGWYSAKVYVALTIGAQASPIVVQINEPAGILAYSEFTWEPGGGRYGHTGVFWLPEATSYPRLAVTLFCESGMPGDTAGSCNYYLTRHA